MDKVNEPENDAAAKERQPDGKLWGGPIWEVIGEYMRDVPEEVLNQLPTDSAERHDYYLYGTNEKTPRES